jgi:Lar family restriction alleviation protein
MTARETGAVGLKPCPFCGDCGGIETLTNHAGQTCFNIFCEVCHASAAAELTRDDAIAAWNTRPQPTPAGEIVERARALALAVESGSPDFLGADDGGCHTCWHRNPDGPELLAIIERQHDENADLLHDLERVMKRENEYLNKSEQQAATIAELREVLEMTTRALEIVNETMAEQGFGQSNSSVAVAQIGRATLERTRGQ